MLGIYENSIAEKTAFVTSAPLLDNQPLFPDVFSDDDACNIFLCFCFQSVYLAARMFKWSGKENNFFVFFLILFPSALKAAVFFRWTEFCSKTTTYVASVIGDLHCCLHCCLNCSLHNCLNTFLLSCWNCSLHSYLNTFLLCYWNCSFHNCLHCCWGNGCTVVVLQHRRASCQGK